MASQKLYHTNRFLLDNPNDLISIDKWQKTVNLLAQLFEAPAGFLVQHTDKGFQVTIASQQASNPYPAGVFIEPEVNIFCRKIVETGKELYVANAHVEPCWDTNPEVKNDGFSSYLGVPVFWPDGRCFGTFCVMDYRKTDYQNSYLELIRHLKEILEADLSLLGLYSEMMQLARLDDLCGINNRRGFRALAEQRIKLSIRNGSNLVMLYVDVDEFKRINDEHGHSLGDEVLKLLAKVLKQCIRVTDVVGRIGGDEFVLLTLCDTEQDLIVLKARIMQAISDAIAANELPHFSVTIGHKTVKPSDSLERVLACADQDMLARKTRRAY
ncbi:sensor domain-containing diguanylate cyclase [Shewanella colwelliana]|uniref:diguanylate cyclase n=1 Tax=Shewanella colwelliana TaxID=23 RepID=A0ABQ4NX74_SHECO|nr:sensor domain-containing diguanylate cyclase [Shewanella colwelliana]MDX1280048.1 sensor domain-containing diguanylate cyclase [Shewanella colwelliana]GIU38923.1 diguanylate cyclase [Shewanella colwelliana]